MHLHVRLNHLGPLPKDQEFFKYTEDRRRCKTSSVHISVDRTTHWYQKGHGFNSCWSLEICFFFQTKNVIKILLTHCKDHSIYFFFKLPFIFKEKEKHDSNK